MASDLKTLEKQRAVIKGKLTRLVGSIETLTVSSELKGRLEVLKQLNEQFDAVQIQIEIADEHTDYTATRVEFENKYYDCMDKINKKLLPQPSTAAVGRTSPRNEATNGGANSLLSRIKIKPFGGEHDRWASFHDAFKSLVHDDDTIPASHTFQILETHLYGPITSVVSSLTATDENYFAAWEMLKKECDKPRLAIQAHLKALLDQPEFTRECPVALKRLALETETRLRSLKGLKVPVQHWDDIIVFIITRKIDHGTRRAWDQILENHDRPSVDRLLEFLHKRARSDNVESEKRTNKFTPSGSKGFSNGSSPATRKAQTLSTFSSNSTCAICQGSHNIWSCAKFREFSTRKRYEVVKQANICVNCLGGDHTTNQCQASGCKKCRKRHNTLLHFEERNAGISVITPETGDTEPVQTVLATLGESEVLLRTTRIIIFDKDNKAHECRALLDSCSQNNFITRALADKLSLTRQNINLKLSGIGQTSQQSSQLVESRVKSRQDKFEGRIKLFILEKLTGVVPSRQIRRRDLDIPRNLSLADPEFDRPGPIDILLGNELFFKLLSVGQVKLKTGTILQKTRLGWIVTGNAPGNKPGKTTSQCYLAQTYLEQQVRKFWEVEEVANPKHRSTAEKQVETHYVANTRRDPSGRYIVRLPIQESGPKLGESFQQAVRRFMAIERRLNANQNLREQYASFLKEYESLGHMQEIADTPDERSNGYYMPHHAVVKTSSLATKLRVVFDASAKSSTGVSLNNILLTGPTIQDDLFTIICRFRIHKIVITADVEKMYRQIRVHSEDTRYQKIVWRERSNLPIRTFKLNTVTYGTSSAPFLAIRTLHRLADDESHRFPLAASVFKNDFYVDDLITGCQNIEQARNLINELESLAASGGLRLRQWVSNEPIVLGGVQSSPDTTIEFEPSENKKTLGIAWDAKTDDIKYSTNSFTKQNTVTKRSVLSELARLFDPLGLLGPVIVAGKIFLQKLWTVNVDWDESLSQELSTYWDNFKRDLPHLSNIRIQRRILIDEPTNIQFHGFSDASQKAYGAVAYIRSISKTGKIQVKIIAAKSRVAPIKTVSLPRLELCAAALLSRLYQRVSTALNIKINSTYFLTDSTIVLQWIQMSPHLLKTFVANRVAEIQQGSGTAIWSHVRTKENPADFLSRGQTAIEFGKNSIWFNGPKWLSLKESSWPRQLVSVNPNIPEQRVATTLITRVDDAHLFARFSDIDKLNRIVAYCRRWKIKGKGSELSVESLELVDG